MNNNQTHSDGYHELNSSRNATNSSFRTVYLNNDVANEEQEFCSNVIITSKYTACSFLPKFLVESFKKLANAYFLLVSILQCVPSISNTGGYPTNAPVLLFILSVDAVLAIIEDRRRHRADRAANSARCNIVDSLTGVPELKEIEWADLKVGTIVKLKNRQSAPADLLILSVHEQDENNPSGICYVETKSLDGETNLKLRQAMEATMKTKTENDAANLKGIVKSELPNRAVTKFSASLELSDDSGAVPVSIKNVILRGCQLRNTEWIYGLVLNTGNDTKIMQSASEAPRKWSSINDVVNRMIIWLFFFLCTCCAVAATVQVAWNERNAEDATYLDWNPEAVEQWFLGFGSYFLLLYQIIPVSLYVTISMVMFLQAIFMSWDLDMYHEETDTPMIVRTMALNEELGQISYVFSDKTGTLTCNVMEFRKSSINGISYGLGTTEIGRAALKRAGKEVPVEKPRNANAPRVPYVNFDDPTLFDALNGKAGVEQQAKVREFFMHLAVCHTVIPEKVEGSNEIRLSASSPDEQALVAGAKFFGYEFESRGLGVARVRVDGKILEYQILDVLEFNSDRKRMSVLSRDPSGKIRLYTKGADSVIFSRLSPACTELRKLTEEQMVGYADDGLRTLCIAWKDIPDSIYEEWSRKYKVASSSLEEIQKRKDGAPNKIDELMEEMEQDLILLGATAIEDKLQDGVPTAIARMRQAGIKVWMLTGDKQETAINISYACQLLNNDMEQIVLNMDDFPTPELLRKQLIEAAERARNSDLEFALVIDGEALDVVLEPSNALSFLSFAQKCSSVVCCRVSPSQKAEVVSLVKNNVNNCRTLSIGDGANDVAMIQRAHIGVGISGQEGMQAVNSSDYAIAQFRYLEKLLLHHGRLNYTRMSRLVGYMFYKNMVLVMAQYYYTFLAGASGQKFYNELGFQAYNVAYTALPIIYLGVFDYDVPPYVSLMFPKLYRPGQRMELFNTYIFLRWMASAIFESSVIFIFTVYAFNDREFATGNAGIVQMGLIAFTLVVIICNLKLCLLQLSWTKYAIALWFIGILAWIPVSIVFSSYWIELFSTDYGSFQNTLDAPIFWLIVPAAIFVALGRHFSWTAFQRMFYPDYAQLIQEKYVTGQLEKHSESIPEESITLKVVDSSIQEELPVTVPVSHSSSIRSRSGNRSDPNSLTRRRSTGYAFSFDTQTTMAESYIASHSVANTASAISDAEIRSRVPRSESSNVILYSPPVETANTSKQYV